MNEDMNRNKANPAAPERTGKQPSTTDVAQSSNTGTMATESLYRQTGESGPGTARMQATPLLNPQDTQTFRDRWSTIQTEFVDEPRKSVEQADALVAELMQKLAQSFAQEKNKLEGQWGRGQDVSTEDLRVALQRYRSFFDRLLLF